jgi:hypothetical protein
MTNPVLDMLTHHRVAEIVAEPPRSWTAEFKRMFLTLPPHLQVYLANHEKRRDVEIRRAQNQRADALKLLAKTEDERDRALARLEELKNGITENQSDTIA